MKHKNIKTSLKIATILVGEAIHLGGCSIDNRFNRPVVGYLVATNNNLIFANNSKVCTHAISNWIEKNPIKLNEFYGSWRNPITGEVEVSISILTLTYFDAKVLAQKFAQKYVYSLQDNKDLVA